MPLSALMNQPVTITTVTDGAVDRYGNPTADTSVTTDTVGYLEQASGTERGDDDAVEVLRWLLVLPAGTAITADDTVTVDGATFEVAGPPWQVHNPRTGLTDHIECALSRSV